MQDVWVTVLGAVALLTRVGFAMYASGASRSKNAADAVVRTLCDFSLAALALWAVGVAILMGDASLVVGRGAVSAAYVLVYVVMVLLATGVTIGVVAERGRFVVVAVSSVMLGGLVVPALGYLAWEGWLERLGYVDVAGSGVVHVAAGAWAAVAAAVVGARSNKFNRDGSSNAIPGHSVVLLGVGVLLLVVGWLPYVTGAAVVTGGRFAPGGPLNVVLSAAAGGAMALAHGRLKYGKTDLVLTCIGVLGGLVGITGCAATVDSWAAVVIGAVAGLLVPWAALLLDVRFRVDDPTSGVAIHLVGGFWGTLATGIFGGEADSWLVGVAVQALGAAACMLAAGALAAVVMFALRATVGVRSKEADEYDGLDLAEHDVNAYPDFQQTMIKSYHLREA